MGKISWGVGRGQPCPTQGHCQPICPLCANETKCTLGSIAQPDFDPHLSFGQVSCAVSNLHNRMGHPHTYPKRHKAIYEQQNCSKSLISSMNCSLPHLENREDRVVRGSHPKGQALLPTQIGTPITLSHRTRQISHLKIPAHG